ncbi:MAG: diguanylate cyclase [Candidatus Ratteibacteria bacterium]
MESYENKILNALLKIHRAVGANLEIDKVCKILVDEIKDITNCSGCAIMLIENQKVRVISESGFEKNLGNIEFTIDTPAIKYILTTKKSIITGDIKNTPEVSSCVPSGCSMSSLICVPIIIQDEVKGIIHVDSIKLNAFSKEDVKFINLLANEISIIIERTELFSKVKEISIKDGLTGCFNRRKFDEDILVEFAKAKRYGRVFSILMIDIDYFKKYNDFYGHQKGDFVLKKMFELWKTNLRSSDFIYRYGGEEFVILLPETDKKSAYFVAEKLRQIVENTEFEGEKESQPSKKITISIGVADSSDAENVENLIKSADKALYNAKKSGRNNVFVSE